MKKESKTWICGKHAVMAALQNSKRTVYEIWLTDKHTEQYFADFKEQSDANIQVQPKEKFNKQFEGRVHQGMAALVGALPHMDLEDVMPQTDLILILDQITDPHNLGACLRSADAFGCGAVIVPDRRAAQLTDVSIKASSGAAETIPVIDVTNLNQTIQQLKDNEFWIVGLDAHTETQLHDVKMGSGKTAIVMGSEGKGLRDLVRKNCDFVAKLPMVGTVESLNVSVATGIALYEVLRQKGSTS